MPETETTIADALAYHVRLILDNERPMADRRSELVLAHLMSDDAEYPHLLGDTLKDWTRDLAGLEAPIQNLMAAEIVSVALNYVDWQAFATGCISTEADLHRHELDIGRCPHGAQAGFCTYGPPCERMTRILHDHL